MKFLRFISSLLLSFVLVLLLVFALPRVFGCGMSCVVSGSMEPAISTGSLIYYRPVKPETLVAGDVVVFAELGTDTITHRVTENDISARRLSTKGDANTAEDFAKAPYDAVLGKVAFDVPGIGYAALYFSGASGYMFLGGVLLISFLLRFIADAASAGRKRRKR